MIRDSIAAERRELAAMLAGLTAGQWDAPTLCDGWTVRHVVAHLTMPFRYPAPVFVLKLALAGGRFQRMSDAVARRDAAMPPAELLAAVRDNAEHRWKPPGGGYEGALVHDVIHTLDITSPLRIEHPFPAGSLRTVLDAVSAPKTRRFFGAQADGVELRATDLDWSNGHGAPVLGQASDLALLLTGRRVRPGALSGEGAARIAGYASR